MSERVIEVTEANFQEAVVNETKPVLIDFWAAWCAPCLMVAPTVERVASEMADSAKIVKVNVDENPALAAKYHVQAIPTLGVFKGGEMVERFVGVQSAETLTTALRNWT